MVIAYGTTQLALTRTKLDTQSSEKRANDFYNFTAAKFNDTCWIPISTIKATMHKHFAEKYLWLKQEGK